MKPYLLFAYEKDGIRGGWNDFRSSHDTLQQAIRAMDKLNRNTPTEGLARAFSEAHIVNILDGLIELHAYHANDYGVDRWLLIADMPARS